MRMYLTVPLLLCLTSSAHAEGFAGLTPGRSTRADAERLLGKPAVRDNVLVFPGERFEAKEVQVRLGDDTGVIDSILIRPTQPPTREKILGWFGAEDVALSVPEGEDRLETIVPAMVRIRVLGDEVTGIEYLSRSVVLEQLRAAAIQHAARGETDAAISTLEHVQRVNPGDAEGYFTIAAILHGSQRDTEALRSVQRGLELSPMHEEGELLRRFVEGGLALPRPGWLGVHWHGREVAGAFGDTPGGSVLEPGDWLVTVDGEQVQGHEHAAELMHHIDAGQEVALRVLRDGREVSVRARAIDARRYLQTMEMPEDKLEQIPVLVAAGDLTAAYALLAKCNQAPRPPVVLYELALIMQRCKLQNGLKAWQIFLDRADDHTPEAWRQHAREAVAAIETRLPPYEKGVESRQARNSEHALQALTEMEPYGCGMWRIMLGACHQDLKQHGAAAEATLEGLRWFPDAYAGWNILASCYETFDLALSRAATVRALWAMARWKAKAAPDSAREEALQRKERVEKALQLWILGDRCASVKLRDQAVEHYRSALALVPDSQELALVLAGHLTANAGQPGEAVQVLEKALESGETPLTGQVRKALAKARAAAKR
jgi:tetratricopeptide (TPR) repeat protein